MKHKETRLALSFLPFYLFTVLLLGSCAQTDDGRCHIKGTVVGEQYEGKRIFLVPFTGPKTAEYVDSVEIKDGKFEFTPDSVQMYKILLDYHYRYGTQELLVIGEPGIVIVTIDSISHGGGTPQNDSLEVWKNAIQQHNARMAFLSRSGDAAKKQGQVAAADSMKAEADSLHLHFKKFTRRMAGNIKDEPLHSFLSGMYPLTYKRTLPDGTVVEMDADTNQPVSK